MNVDSMKRPLSLAVCLLAVAALAPSRLLAQEASGDWQFSATVYGWFPDIGGQTSFPGGADGTIDVDVSTILEHLKMSVQGSFEVRKGSWGAFTDIVYLDVGESKSETRDLEVGGEPLPASVSANVDFDLKSTIWTFAGTYRVANGDAATIDVLLGARQATFKQALDWEFGGNFGPVTPPPITGNREAKVDLWDAIVGAKGRFAFGAEGQWVVPYYFDVGTGDAELTWQGMLGLAYAFGWGDLGVAWRYLDYDLDSDGPISDMNFNGPALGATFRW